ncbi:hypothetical protein HXX76_006193 [Chlamydomonas incerta]|uniref:Uncharacterized protein n=1 Tax=Chlamydomonas incerta TaxID=51695 RepID=A0A835TD71_CHLIN|nr:hypothetical protein HXX76_006193 [Chlamydomonas incerta]|eukprot:KAG2436665.1 hypothetical protein HXX76_006193 [Chlamydomonas incerta]
MARVKQALLALAIFALVATTASGFDVMSAYYNAQCEKYQALNMTSPEGKAACRADTANRCYVVPNTGRTCTSSWGAQLLLDNMVCPGTPAYRDQQCYVKFKDECIQDPNCGWGDVAYFGGGAARDRFTPVAEANAGGPINWIMCRSKEYSCSAVNNLMFPTGGTYIDPADYNATRSCIAAGCYLSWIDGFKTRARGANNTDNYYQCSVFPNYYYSLMYPSRFDRPLTDAYNTCGVGTGYDRARCEGAKVPSFPPTAT